MKPRCFFAGRPGAGPCDGAIIRAHLIPKQLLKREFPEGAVLLLIADGSHKWVPWRRGQQFGDAYRTLQQLCEDARSWVPCCGGIVGNGGHHGMLDQSRKLRIDRESLPLAVVEFAAELGLEWFVEREYGPVAA